MYYKIVSWLMFSALAGSFIQPAFAEEKKVLATVNDTPITQQMYDAYADKRNAKSQDGMPEANPDTVLEELIGVELVVQDVEKKGIDKQPEILDQMAWQRRSLLVTAGMREYLKSHPITDVDLKKVYDKEVAKLDQKEYKARHILLESEEEATEVIKTLNDGSNFADLAKEKSTGPTGKQGGDLGWFSPAKMVKPFSKAVAAMEKGSYTKKPVKTQFGWHVILLEDSRDVQPPPFDKVKNALQAQVQKQRVDEYVAELRKTAKIDVKKK